MYRKGHLGISLIVFSPILALLFQNNLALTGLFGLIIILLTANLPDIDIKPPFRYFLTHRGETHTIWFAILIGILSSITFSQIPSSFTNLTPVMQFVFGFVFGFIGILNHLIGDVITPTGIKPLWPIGPRYKIHITTAKGVWRFETLKNGSQQEMTYWETIRHGILNSNRIFLVIGALALVFSFSFYSGSF